jgi:hypothetical protein
MTATDAQPDLLDELAPFEPAPQAATCPTCGKLNCRRCGTHSGYVDLSRVKHASRGESQHVDNNPVAITRDEYDTERAELDLVADVDTWLGAMCRWSDVLEPSHDLEARLPQPPDRHGGDPGRPAAVERKAYAALSHGGYFVRPADVDAWIEANQ